MSVSCKRRTACQLRVRLEKTSAPSRVGPVEESGLSPAADRRKVELADHIRLAQIPPHIDDGLAGEVEVAIGRMRRAQDEDVAATYHLLEREQVGIGGHEGIRGQHGLRQARERLL